MAARSSGLAESWGCSVRMASFTQFSESAWMTCKRQARRSDSMRSHVTASPKLARADLSSCSTVTALESDPIPTVNGRNDTSVLATAPILVSGGAEDEGNASGTRWWKKRERCSRVPLTSSLSKEALKIGRCRRNSSRASWNITCKRSGVGAQLFKIPVRETRLIVKYS